VGGLITNLLMSAFLLPTLYVWVAREGDKLPEGEESFEAGT
jgi:cobalt-zinc-cadmium resistance protein CzcA